MAACMVPSVPKLWAGTIEAHRRQVREAVFAATTAMVEAAGLRGVTMSGIAEAAGVGRATLYKYFADVESILQEWHQEQIGCHLDHLGQIAVEPTTPLTRLTKALHALAHLVRRSGPHHHASDIVADLHSAQHMNGPESAVRALLAGLISEAVVAGEVRDDVPVGDLALHCLNAAIGARYASSTAAAVRLVELALVGVRPPDASRPARGQVSTPAQ